MLSVIPAAIVEMILGWLFSFHIVINALFIGFVEEYFKFLAVFLFIYRKKHIFNSIMDGMVYSTAAAMGFASLENILYIFTYANQGIFTIFILRALLATIGHLTFAAWWGYALGKKRMGQIKSVLGGVTLAAVFHAFYDALVFSQYLALGAVILVVFLAIHFFRDIRHTLKNSPFRDINKKEKPFIVEKKIDV